MNALIECIVHMAFEGDSHVKLIIIYQVLFINTATISAINIIVIKLAEFK